MARRLRPSRAAVVSTFAIAPRLTLVKQVVNANGGTAVTLYRAGQALHAWYESRAAETDDPAVRELAAKAKSGTIDPAEINERVLSEHLYTRHYPDPDLLIRTSGEMRVSNFLLWQSAY